MTQTKQPFFIALMSLLGMLVLVFVISTISDKTKSIEKSVETKKIILIDPNVNPNKHAQQAKAMEIERRFNQAVVMLHSKQYDNAIKALHRVLELAPRMPEAHVNMGFAFLGGGDFKTARDFFASALELNINQINAYYGLAVASEGLGHMEAALGAMRTYVHLSPPDSPYVKKARAALWEWQAAREAQEKLKVSK